MHEPADDAGGDGGGRCYYGYSKKAMARPQDVPIRTLDNRANDQNLDHQLDGVALGKVFTEKFSGANTGRPQLEAMLKYVGEGDVIPVLRPLSRLSVATAIAIGHISGTGFWYANCVHSAA